MKAIERIYQYIDSKGIKPISFEKENGLSNGYLGKQLKRNADLGEGVFIKILENCPEINPEWLLTGKGEMLKTATREGSPPKDRQKEIDRLLELLDQKDHEIERLKKRQANFDLQRVAENDPKLTKKNK